MKRTVLLVEDEVLVRSLERDVLMHLGYSVLEAADGKSALERSRAHEGQIDLLMTDVLLPDCRGTDLAARVVAARPEVRVLYLSGYTDEVVAEEVGAGAAFLQKPFTIVALREKLREVLGSSPPA
jgi:hypothetical protein